MQRPPPLRTDGSNEFARHSMQVRIPRIARDVVERGGVGASCRARIERLASEIERDAPLPAPAGPAPDLEAWEDAHAAHAGETWLGTEWFHAELAFYFELGRACRFWETGLDPFADVKDEELAGTRPWDRVEVALSPPGPRERRLHELVEHALWGNRVDLSYAVAAGRTQTEGDLLVDDRPAALPLLASPACHLHLVADNTGTELALDLALAACVLEEPSARVTVHVKVSPVFVSDAMVQDVWRLLERMSEAGERARRAARVIGACFEQGRFALAPDPFWSSPLFLWRAPAHLRRALGSATLVVVKGDANYRRLVGDALWAPATPLGAATAYLPAPVLCLRTMKSDPVLGLPSGLAESLDRTAPRWRIDGQRGIIELAAPVSRPEAGPGCSA